MVTKVVKTKKIPALSLRDLVILRAFMDFPVGTPLRFTELQTAGVTTTYCGALLILSRLQRRDFVEVVWWSTLYDVPTGATEGGAFRKWKMTNTGWSQTKTIFAQLRIDLSAKQTKAPVQRKRARSSTLHSNGELIVAQVRGYFAGLSNQLMRQNPYREGTVVFASWRVGFSSGIAQFERDTQYVAKLIARLSPPKRGRAALLKLPAGRLLMIHSKRYAGMRLRAIAQEQAKED